MFITSSDNAVIVGSIHRSPGPKDLPAMTFTRRTYRVAIRRSIAKEAVLHGEHAGTCFRGPEAW